MKKVVFFLLASLIVLVSACKKAHEPVPVASPATVSVSSVYPSSGAYNSVVTITGQNFSPVAANDTVKFNGVRATVQSASPTSIKALVPRAAGTGTISVSTPSSKSIFRTAFTYVPTTMLFFAGTDGANDVYWQNGIENVLPIDKPNSYVYSMAVSDTSIYCAGYNGSSFVYWKNGAESAIPVYANAIAVSGSDVYFAGTNGQGSAEYWKNGTVYSLPGMGNPTYIQAMALSGADVFFAGSDGTYSAVYWKNGVEFTLPVTSSPNYSLVYAMAVSGTDVYFAGQDGQRAVYWKNGVEFPLPMNGGSGAVTAMAVAGTDVYFAGVDYRSAVYWKNGVETTLPLINSADIYSSVAAMAISGTDVYIAGNESPTGTLTNVAEYWKNGSVQALPVTTAGTGRVSAMSVVTQ